jgi:hypothetical protein
MINFIYVIEYDFYPRSIYDDSLIEFRKEFFQKLERQEFKAYEYKGDLPQNIIDIDKIPVYI